MKKRIRALILALAMVFALAACGGSGEQGGGTGTSATNTGTPRTEAPENSGGAPTELRVGMTTSMGDLSPFGYSSVGRNQIRYWIYEYVAIFTEFGQTWEEMEWQLAKNIEQVDSLTYKIELYDYIVDAIGNPVKASDVAFCFNEVAAAGIVSRATKYLDVATAIDNVTLEIKLQTDIVGALEYLVTQVPIVSEKTYNEHQDQMTTLPITTAAYQITESVDGSYMLFEKNDNYWQTDESVRSIYAKQPVETIRYLIIPEASQAVIALQTGEVDMLASLAGNDLSYFVNADGTNVDGFNSSFVQDSKPVDLVFNMSEGPEGDLFRDNLPLRQAILHAINPDDVVAIACDGRAEVIHDLGMNTCGDYSPEWDDEPYFDYDLDLAKELLAEAGYPEGMKDGQQLTIRLICATAYDDAAQVIQGQLMQLGINVSLQVLDDAMFSTLQMDPTSWDIWLDKKGNEGYITGTYDNIMLQNKEGVGARTFIVDDKLESLLVTAHNISTHTKDAMDELHYYVVDNAIARGVYVPYVYSVSREGITPYLHPWGFLCPNVSTFTG